MITERSDRRCRLRWQIAPAECQREEKRGAEQTTSERSVGRPSVSSARVDLIIVVVNRRKGVQPRRVAGRGKGEEGGRRDPRSGSCRRRRSSVVIYPLAIPRRQEK